MSTSRVEQTLAELGVPEEVARVRSATLLEALSDNQVSGPNRDDPKRLVRLAYLYEREAVPRYGEFANDDAHEVTRIFSSAYACWMALAKLLDTPTCREILEAELATDYLPLQTNLAFRLAVAGVLAKRTPETRLELESFQFQETQDDDWRAQLLFRVFVAFVLLVRKGGGWSDIAAALSIIGELRDLQAQKERVYLDKKRDTENEAAAALELVGLYHLAQIITVTGAYLREGSDSVTQTSVRLDRHKDHATEAFDRVGRETLSHLAELLWMGCREMVRNSVWTHVSGLGEKLRQFVQSIAGEARHQPVIELWPSQQDALRRNLLDPYKRAILVEMPTSAGKTLLAKFSIVQTHALNPNGVIAYVVPTRALVNQVTIDLRDSFRDIGLHVEQAVPAFELDPTEARLLSSKPHILVTTPEKLDLLIRKDHVSTTDLTLVVADEAHNIRDEGRGERLELLLGMIKRDRPGSRFLLLSPFLPNDKELVRWLGDERAADPIQVHWRPGNKVVGVITLTDRAQNKKLVLRTVPAADNTDVPAGLDVSLGSGINVKKTLTGLTSATAKTVMGKGAVLVLCKGPGTAMTRAREIAEELPELPSSPRREMVCRYLESEIGRSSGLVDLLKYGVAYHHSGLSQEARWLVESLIRASEVQVICGTTTLAQGVNFPIRTVIVETLKKGTRDLTYQDFWNIAGRAGRTLMDTTGMVGFPAPSKTKEEEFASFLQGEALEITSQLATLLERADQITGNFTLQTVYSWPQLSALLQFLAHAVKVSGAENVGAEVEDLLRASLVYHQAQRFGRDALRKLVRLCKSYVELVQGNKPLVALADQTGFATPSVLLLLRQKSTNPELSSGANWIPERLFGSDLQPLITRVAAIASLPEIRLGQGKGQPFSAKRVAEILRDWVRGENLDTLSTRYRINDDEEEDGGGDPDRRVMNFSSYLFSKLIGVASWGFGALETVCLAGSDDAVWQSAGHVPSMIYFGVQRREAVWLRMIGIPRVVANGLADVWIEDRNREPDSYEDLRSWVSSLTDDQWKRAVPPGAALQPADAKQLWNEFTA